MRVRLGSRRGSRPNRSGFKPWTRRRRKRRRRRRRRRRRKGQEA